MKVSTSVIGSIWDALSRASAQRHREKQDTWQKTVVEVDEGRLTDVAEIQVRLEALGKTAADLEAATALRRRRIGLAAKWNAAVAAEAELPKTEAQLQKKQSEIDEFVRKKNLEMEPLYRQLEVCRRTIAAGRDCRDQLIKTASPERHTELKAIAEKQQADGTRAMALRVKAADQRTIRDHNATADNHSSNNLASRQVDFDLINRNIDSLVGEANKLHEECQAANRRYTEFEDALTAVDAMF